MLVRLDNVQRRKKKKRGDASRSNPPDVEEDLQVAGAPPALVGAGGDGLAVCDTEPTASQQTTKNKKKKKKKKSHRQFEVKISTSDAEADTVKDRFWRNLDEGVLPEELYQTDLYSGVGSQFDDSDKLNIILIL